MTELEMREQQEEAKRRVLEMQSRSRYAAAQMNRTLGNREEPPLRQSAPADGPAHAENRPLPREELERLFILSLCLLLSQEDADQSVILGLMYLLT